MSLSWRRGCFRSFQSHASWGAFTGLTFSLYMSGKFGATKRFAPLPCAPLEPPLRRLYVMAFFLSELSKVKIPPCGGQYTKLYDIFTKELYELLSSGTLRDASPSLRSLTAAAVRLQAFPEAETCFSCMPPRPADQKD